MARSASKAAPKKAAKVDPFPNMRCHHRDGSGKPDCTKTREKASVNLCPAHQAAWSKAARERRAAAKPKAAKAAKSAGASPATTKAARDRRLAKSNGGQLRTTTPPVAVARVNAPEQAPATLQLVTQE